MPIKTQINPSLFPLVGATCIFTPFNRDGSLDYTNAIANTEGIAGALTIVKATTMDTITNERGENLELPNGRVYNVTLNMNSLNYMIHNFLTSKIVRQSNVSDKIPMRKIISFVPEISGSEGTQKCSFVFDTNYKPISVNGDLQTIVSDNFSNVLEKVSTSSTLAEGQYFIDTTLGEIVMEESSAGKPFTCVYFYEGKDVIESKENPKMATKYFRLEVINKLQGEGDDVSVNGYSSFYKMKISGDVNELAMQKSPNAPIVYNLQTAPIPEGESPFINRLENDVIVQP